jgi:hypothetical protein
MMAQSPERDLRRRQTVNAPTIRGAAPQSSADSFNAAKASSEQRAVRSLEDADASAGGGGSGGSRTTSRRIGDRIMALIDGVWTDSQQRADRRTVKVRAYSEAWFTLAREITGLGEVFALGDRVRVDGKRVAIEVTDGGAERLDSGQVAAIKAEW